MSSLFLLVTLIAYSAEPARVQRAFATIPLSFERNIGQGPRGADFVARTPGYLLAVSGSEATLFGDRTPLRMRLLGAGSRAWAELLDPLPGKSHYFIGNDPSRWRTNVQQYRRLRVAGIYPGIHITFYGRADHLEYDFEVEPGADPRAIQMEFDAAGPVEMDAEGNLLIPSGNGNAKLHAPLIYQRSGGELRAVRGNYKLAGGNRIQFELDKYDARLPVVIDPVLVYSTTFSGGRPVFNDIAVDKAGNTYLTGCAASGMPLVSAYLEELTTDRDAILAKISADGNTLLYSTYMGGGCAAAIALDAGGNVILAGTTTNRYFPLRNPAFRRQGGSFLTKLSADGSALIYSTFLGGDLTDAVAALALDQEGSAYVTGRTRAASFPATAPLPVIASPDADQPSVRTGFAAKFNASGAPVYSALLGAGVSPAAVAVDAQGAAYVGGALCGERYPVTADGTAGVPAGCDSFVAKLLPDASGFAYTYTFGGSGWDGVSEIALDGGNNVYVSGITFSADFPVTAGAPQSGLKGNWDAFVARLAPDGAGLVYATYLGGSREETPAGLVVDSAGRATVAGITTSADFPLADALRPRRNGAAEPVHFSDDGGASWASVFAEGEQSGAFYPWRGSVTALAATSDPHIVYSADRFNIYRSADAGATWQTVHSRPNQWQVRTVAAHPSNPDALYVASLPAPTSTAASTTVWFSSDRGETFVSRGVFATGAADRFNLWISAADPNVLYALIRRRTDPQLYRSDDGGQTWQRTGALPDLLQSMALDSSTTTRLYAGTDSGLYVTADGGASWSLMDGTQCPVDRLGCQFQELYTEPSNPNVIVFTRRGGREYGYTNQQLQVHRSADGGRTWNIARTPVVADAAAFAIDPSDPDVWYVAFTGTSGLYRSADSGRNWAALSPSAPFWTDGLNGIAVLPLQPSRVLVATSAGSEGFLTTLSADGGSWVQSTYLGGAGNDPVTGLRADDLGWFVIVNNAVQRLENSNGGCELVLAPAETTLHFAGSTARVQVRTGAGCAWRVDNPAPWIAIASASSGSGWGNIELIAGPNPSSTARAEKLLINGQTLTVTQPGGPPCTLTPDVFRIIPSARTSDGAAVNFTAGCQWSVAKDAAWVTLDTAVDGVTTSVIPYTVEANTSASARRTVLTFSPKGSTVSTTHTILQWAASCRVKVSSSADRVPASGGPVTLRIESDPADCSAWVADSGVSWAPPAPGPVPSPGAAALPGAPNWGIGNGSVTFLFAQNNNPTERFARLQMAGVGVLITQSGVSCAYTIKPDTAQVIDAGALQGMLTVSAPAGCDWTAASNNTWLRITSVTPTRGTSFASTPTGNGRVYFNADANTSGAARTGTITVAGQAFTLRQAP